MVVPVSALIPSDEFLCCRDAVNDYRGLPSHPTYEKEDSTPP